VKRSSGSKLALFLVTWWMVLPSPAEDANGNPDFTVRFYDYAGVDRATMQAVAACFSRIFETADLRVEWLNCRVSWSEPASPLGCEGPPLESVFIVRLLPGAAEPSHSGRQNRLGAAIMTAEGGRYIDVFLEGVDQAARLHYVVNRGRLMAYTIAHEVGHLLFGPEAHSGTGVMRGQWSRDDYEIMWRQWFEFTKCERALLRQKLAARTTLAR